SDVLHHPPLGHAKPVYRIIKLADGLTFVRDPSACPKYGTSWQGGQGRDDARSGPERANNFAKFRLLHRLDRRRLGQPAALPQMALLPFVEQRHDREWKDRYLRHHRRSLAQRLAIAEDAKRLPSDFADRSRFFQRLLRRRGLRRHVEIDIAFGNDPAPRLARRDQQDLQRRAWA